MWSIWKSLWCYFGWFRSCYFWMIDWVFVFCLWNEWLFIIFLLWVCWRVLCYLFCFWFLMVVDWVFFKFCVRSFVLLLCWLLLVVMVILFFICVFLMWLLWCFFWCFWEFYLVFWLFGSLVIVWYFGYFVFWCVCFFVVLIVLCYVSNYGEFFFFFCNFGVIIVVCVWCLCGFYFVFWLWYIFRVWIVGSLCGCILCVFCGGRWILCCLLFVCKFVVFKWWFWSVSVLGFERCWYLMLFLFWVFDRVVVWRSSWSGLKFLGIVCLMRRWIVFLWVCFLI